MLLLDARRAARFARRRARAARRPGPLALGRRGDRRGARGARPRARPARPRPLRACRRRSPRCTPTSRATGPQIAALYGELGRAHRLARGRAQPRGRGGRGGGPRGRPGDRRRPRRSTTTATCTRRAASCCAGSGAATRRAPPTGGRWRSSTTTPSGACSSAGWPSCADAARILRVVAWEAQSLLPLPPHYHPGRVGEVWRVAYEDRAREAPAWAAAHGVAPASEDAVRIALLAVDVQNTFCIPGFELFVGGRSGTGAVDDNRRLCEFLYRNLGGDHADLPEPRHPPRDADLPRGLARGRPAATHPDPYTLVSPEDVATGAGRSTPRSPTRSASTSTTPSATSSTTRARWPRSGKYDLTVWPYHAMLGGIGHALVSAVEEAVFFHGIARQQPARVPGQGRQLAHRALLDARSRGDRGARRRAPRRARTPRSSPSS